MPDVINEVDAGGIDSFFYTIVYNFTMAPSAFIQNLSVPLQVYPKLYQIKTSVDNGILSY